MPIALRVQMLEEKKKKKKKGKSRVANSCTLFNHETEIHQDHFQLQFND